MKWAEMVNLFVEYILLISKYAIFIKSWIIHIEIYNVVDLMYCNIQCKQLCIVFCHLYFVQCTCYLKNSHRKIALIKFHSSWASHEFHTSWVPLKFLWFEFYMKFRWGKLPMKFTLSWVSHKSLVSCVLLEIS